MAKPDAVRDRIHEYSAEPEKTPEFDPDHTKYAPKKWGAMIGWLNKYCVTDDLRHLILGWLFAYPGQKFEPISSTTLTPQQKNAISKWIGSSYNEDLGEWETRPEFPGECVDVLNAARRDYYELIGEVTPDLPFVDDQGELQGVVSGSFDEDDPLWDKSRPKPPEGAVWCYWCMQVVSAPGVPCESCQKLGAVAHDLVEVELLPEPPKKKGFTGIAI